VPEELRLQIALTLLHGFGKSRTLHLLSKVECIEQIFSASIRDLHRLSGLNPSILSGMKRKNALERAKKEIAFIQKNGIRTHYYFDETYPRRLRHCPDAPLMLYSRGDFEFNPTYSVAVVGTRNASDYGKQMCKELLTELSYSGVQVVSGLAYGVDVFAHRLCVDMGIETIGVLGHGLDRMYPQAHRSIANRMCQKGGLLTEYMHGTNPDRENFPMRNRIVAGMADALVVVESGEKGGSLITASLANDYHREVFAFPGDCRLIESKGCNQLIQQNKAQLITCGKDVIALMNWKKSEGNGATSQQSSLIELSSDEQKMIACFNGISSKHIDLLTIETSLSISQTIVLLFQLEMKGMVQSLPGNMYRLN
jgi:DNA processing protein